MATFQELGRNRMATFQELADEAFSDLPKKHNVPIDLKDALRKSVRAAEKASAPSPKAHPRRASKRRHQGR